MYLIQKNLIHKIPKFIHVNMHLIQIFNYPVYMIGSVKGKKKAEYSGVNNEHNFF